MARTIDDVLARRVRFFLDACSLEASDKVAKLLAKELGHDEVEHQSLNLKHSQTGFSLTEFKSN
jgi:glycerol-3-phosphate dehydrogenase